MQAEPPPQMIQPQILSPPQPIATIPPLPKVVEEHVVNVICIEGKDKEKVMEPEVMLVKRARIIARSNGQ